MTTTSKPCPQCGAALPAHAPGGLCPRCLVAMNLVTATQAPAGAEGAGGTRVVSGPADEPMPVSEVARLFPHLEILECLGRGGMGAVYRARQPRLNRCVALKILARGRATDAAFAERFTREAQALARLSHPGIVAVHDFGEAGGHYFLLMEFVDGANLRQVLAEQKLAPAEALAIVPQICEALQYAHHQGVVHRDIKPENILLDQQGRVKIADFGIAKLLGTEAQARHLTGDKDVIGTPHYMAPEQIEKPQTVDHRADIYSLGVVFYEMLTGELPLGKFQPPSRKVQVDVRLDEVVLHALEKEPSRRYQHANQVKTDVEAIAGTPPHPPATTSSPVLARQRRGSLVKSVCFAVAAGCFLIAAVSFASSGNAMAAVLSLAAVVSFSIAGYRHFRAGAELNPPPPPDAAFGRPPSVAPAAPERRGACYFSTPERMRNCFPSAAAQIFVCKGELRLELEALTFLTPWQTRVVIPLQAVEDLSVGQFQMWTTPWIMHYARVNFLSVTFSQDGRRQTVHLTPVPAAATSAQQINEQVSEWFEAIQEAVRARTSAPPRVSEPRAVSISAEPAWNKKGLPLLVAFLVVAGLFVWRFRSVLGSAPEPLGILLLVVTWLAFLAVLWFSFGFLRANHAISHGELDAVTSNEPPASLLPGCSVPNANPVPPRWVTVARWTARVSSTLLLAFYGFFVLVEGLPPLATQPEGVQLNFVALGFMLAGFLVGWKREGTAALLIAFGWTLWQIAEHSVRWNLFQTPLPVAALYGFCWWAKWRRTGVVAGVVAALAVALGLGRLFCPTSVFVGGVVASAATGQPLANAEVRLGRPRLEPATAPAPNARSDRNGRFRLYVGWYAADSPVVIAASGYQTLTTNLGPRSLGRHQVTKHFQLKPAAMSVPPVVIRTMPECGVTDVDPDLNELRVTFSKPMQDGNWAWTIWGEDNFPEMTGPPRYLADGRTCVLPVRLKPGRLYATWINSETHQTFSDTEGQPAVPYLLIFETRK
jgi:hypothetical protein